VKEFVLPTLTFEDTLTLHRDGREIRLMHFAGHTRGDVMVYLPRGKVLVMGDLLDDLPYTGHGAVCRGQAGRDHLHLLASVFESLVSQVETSARAGLSLDDTLKKVDLGNFRERVIGGDEVATRYWNFFMSEAAKRTYAEATGQVKD
jgi:hypothetical protein